MSRLVLLDVAPGPARVVGVGALTLIAVVVLIFVAALVVGFVFLLKRRRSKANQANLEATSTAQPSSPNQ